VDAPAPLNPRAPPPPPQADLQAMARAHRIGQTQEVRVLRLMTASPIEEKILATASEKLTSEALYIEAGQFNDRSSDAGERREMLKRLIAQSADSLEDEGIPTDAELNEMMARPNAPLGLSQDDEFARYNAMDRARADTEGGPRLVAEVALPDWLRRAELLRQEAAEGEVVEPMPEGGRRRAERVSYAAQTDSDFNRELREEEPRKREAKRKAPGGRQEEEEGEAATERLKRLLASVARASRGGRKLATLFLQLPTEAEAPGYYRAVPSPVSLAEMREAVKNGANVAAVDASMRTMAANARLYNEAGSQVMSDAKPGKAIRFRYR